MNEVFMKTRELGEAIMKSEEYITMKACEDAAAANEVAAKTMGLYLEKRGALEELMQSESPDPQAMSELSSEMDALQEALQGIDDIARLTEARADFNHLIAQVNQVLRFIITGEMGEEESEEGCTGSCSSCHGGCHHTLH